MDITPQVINEVEFHQKMRGYDPDEVDDFLERVAAAVGTMQEHLREAAERMAEAERRAAQVQQQAGAAPTPSATIEDDTETIRRTLILAQRTADAAIKEAEETAQRTVAAAQEQANQLYREAQEHAQQVVTAAESEARRSADETRQRLVQEIVALEQTRDSLRSDHGVLTQHLDGERTKLRATIDQLTRLLDDPAALQPSAPPSISGATLPPLSDEGAPGTAGDAEPAIELTDAAMPVTGGVVYSTPAAEAPPFGEGAAPASAEEDEAWARFVGDEAGAEPLDDGPPTQAIRLDDAGDDAYLAELRKAMIEDNGAELFEADERRPRFGRRR